MKPLLAIACAALTALTGCSDESGRTVEAYERLKQSTTETVEALRDLTAAQKDVFVEQADAHLERLDERIDELRDDASDQAQERLEELKTRREELGRRLENVREASGDAWADVKGGFLDALEEFERADEADAPAAGG